MTFKTILIDNRYLIYSNGTIYDTLKAKDIPKKIFDIRNKLIDIKELI